MSKRQRIFFRIGTWALFATAAIHLAGHFAPQPEPSGEAERTLRDLMTSYRKDFGAGFSRTTLDFLKGFSLSFSAFLLWTGLLNLAALRGFADGARLRRLAALDAALSGVVVAITWKYFFLPPLVCMAVVFLSFLAAALGGGEGAPSDVR
jgi:hypothetical protein